LRAGRQPSLNLFSLDLKACHTSDVNKTLPFRLLPGFRASAAALVFLVSVRLLDSATPPSSYSDMELGKAIVGTWEAPVPANQFPLKKAFRTFYRDGGYQLLLVYSTGKTEGTVETLGTWRISDGMLVQRVTKTAYPKLLGSETRVRIMSIDETHFVERNDKGTVEMRRGYLPNLPSAQKWASAMGLENQQIKAFAIETPQLKYPPEAVKAHITGHGFFKINIDKRGRAVSVETLRSTRSAILDKAAIETLMRWRFKPRTMKELTMPVHFTIRDR
jgi:TonB family protein